MVKLVFVTILIYIKISKIQGGGERRDGEGKKRGKEEKGREGKGREEKRREEKERGDRGKETKRRRREDTLLRSPWLDRHCTPQRSSTEAQESGREGENHTVHGRQADERRERRGEGKR